VTKNYFHQQRCVSSHLLCLHSSCIPIVCSVLDVWLRMFRSIASGCGPCWIKLVQWAATRPDLFGRDVTKVLATLHTDSPAHSAKESVRAIEVAFDRPLHEIFEEFDHDPIGTCLQ
jgi:hypothetical protein